LFEQRPATRQWTVRAFAYGGMVIAAIGLFLLIRSHGETLVAPAPDPEASNGATSPQANVLLRVLSALTAVIILGQILARLFAYISQPPVIGEVMAGILLGPSLIGVEASEWILPSVVAPYLGVIAQLGIILYMFIVGLELNAELLKERAHTTVAISHASIVVPFVLGALLALGLYPRLSSRDVPFTSFALFLGAAMSITAFPVLARILSDRSMTKTDLGGVALSCAAADDVTAWCLLALVVGVAKAQIGEGLLVALGTLAYITFMFLVARPVLVRVVARWRTEALPRAAVALVFVALLLSALTTELIGIHAIFGAFLLGAVIPHDSAVARHFPRQLEQVVTILLLPAFFALTGMRTRIDFVAGADQWLWCGVIVLVATLGKFGGTYIAGRLTGLHGRDAAILGTLMNTRGLMELIVLNIGLDLKIISPTLFAMMVLMALVTTMATSPIVDWLMRQGSAAPSTPAPPPSPP
jgi:Kef-type K+ transport system membrane component KefB